MESNVRAILGPAVPDVHVRMCTISIVSQCFSLYRGPIKPGSKIAEVFDMGPEILAEHIYRFSLAGLETTRKMFTTQEEL